MRPCIVLSVVLAGCPRRDNAPVPRPPAPDALDATVAVPTVDATRVVDGPTATHIDADLHVALRHASPWYDVAHGVRWRQAVFRFDARSPSLRWPGRVSRTLVWWVMRLELGHVELAIERTRDDSIERHWSSDSTALAVLNAGFFEPGFRPSGLVRNGGRLIAPFAPHGGSGLLVVNDAQAHIDVSDQANGGANDAAFVLQCGPRVVERGGIPGIVRDDRAFFARTAACVREGGRVLDFIATWDPDDPLRGPGLFYFARLLSAPSPVGDPRGCDEALNLDGGPSTTMFVRTANGTVHKHIPLGPVPWVIVVRSRTGSVSRTDQPSDRVLASAMP